MMFGGAGRARTQQRPPGPGRRASEASSGGFGPPPPATLQALRQQGRRPSPPQGRRLSPPPQDRRSSSPGARRHHDPGPRLAGGRASPRTAEERSQSRVPGSEGYTMQPRVRVVREAILKQHGSLRGAFADINTSMRSSRHDRLIDAQELHRGLVQAHFGERTEELLRIVLGWRGFDPVRSAIPEDMELDLDEFLVLFGEERRRRSLAANVPLPFPQLPPGQEVGTVFVPPQTRRSSDLSTDGMALSESQQQHSERQRPQGWRGSASSGADGAAGGGASGRSGGADAPREQELLRQVAELQRQQEELRAERDAERRARAELEHDIDAVRAQGSFGRRPLDTARTTSTAPDAFRDQQALLELGEDLARTEDKLAAAEVRCRGLEQQVQELERQRSAAEAGSTQEVQELRKQVAEAEERLERFEADDALRQQNLELIQTVEDLNRQLAEAEDRRAAAEVKERELFATISQQAGQLRELPAPEQIDTLVRRCQELEALLQRCDDQRIQAENEAAQLRAQLQALGAARDVDAAAAALLEQQRRRAEELEAELAQERAAVRRLSPIARERDELVQQIEESSAREAELRRQLAEAAAVPAVHAAESRPSPARASSGGDRELMQLRQQLAAAHQRIEELESGAAAPPPPDTARTERELRALMDQMLEHTEDFRRSNAEIQENAKELIRVKTHNCNLLKHEVARLKNDLAARDLEIGELRALAAQQPAQGHAAPPAGAGDWQRQYEALYQQFAAQQQELIAARQAADAAAAEREGHARLRAEVERLKAELAHAILPDRGAARALEDEIDGLRRRCAELQRQLDAEAGGRRQARAAEEQLQEKYLQWRREVEESHERQTREFVRSVEDKTEELGRLRAQLQQRDADLSALQGELRQARAAVGDRAPPPMPQRAAEGDTRAELLRKEVEERDSAIARHLEDIGRQEARVMSLHGIIDEQRRHNADLQEAIVNQTLVVENLRLELRDAEARAEAAEGEAEQERKVAQGLREIVKERDKSIGLLREVTDARAQENEVLLEDLRVLQEAADGADAERTRRIAEHVRGREQSADWEDRQRLAVGALGDRADQAERLRQELNARRDHIDQLEQQIEDLLADKERSERALIKANQFEEKQFALEAEIEELAHQLGQVRRERDELRQETERGLEAKEEAAMLRRRLLSLEDEGDRMRSSAALAAQADEAAARADALQEDNEQLAREYRLLKEEKREAEEELRELRRRAERTAQLEVLAEEGAEARLQLERLQGELAAEQRAHDELRAQHTRGPNDTEEELLGRVRELELTLAAREETARHQQQGAEQLRELAAELEGQLAALKAERDEAVAAAAAVRQQLAGRPLGKVVVADGVAAPAADSGGEDAAPLVQRLLDESAGKAARAASLQTKVAGLQRDVQRRAEADREAAAEIQDLRSRLAVLESERPGGQRRYIDKLVALIEQRGSIIAQALEELGARDHVVAALQRTLRLYHARGLQPQFATDGGSAAEGGSARRSAAGPLALVPGDEVPQPSEGGAASREGSAPRLRTLAAKEAAAAGEPIDPAGEAVELRSEVRALRIRQRELLGQLNSAEHRIEALEGGAGARASDDGSGRGAPYTRDERQADMGRLRRMLDEKNETIRRQGEELDALEFRLGQRETLIDALQDKLSSTPRPGGIEGERVEQLLADIDDLNIAKRQAQAAVHSRDRQIEGLNQTVARLEAQLETKGNTIGLQQRLLDEKNQAIQLMRDMVDSPADPQTVQQLLGRLDAVDTAHREMREHSERVMREVDWAEREVEQRDLKVQEKETVILDLRRGSELHAQEIVDLKTGIIRSTRELDEEVKRCERLEGEMIRLTGRCEKQDEIIAGLRDSLDQRDSALAQAERDVADLKREQSRLQDLIRSRGIDEVEDMRAAWDEREERLQHLQQKHQDLSSFMQEQEVVTVSLEKTVKVLQGEKQELQGEVQHLRATLEEVEARGDELAQQLSDAQARADDLHHELLHLREDAEEAAAMRRDWEALRGEQETKEALLLKLVEDKNGALEHLRVALADVQEQLRDVEVQLKDRDNTVQRQHDVIAELQKTCDVVRSNYRRRDDAIRDLEDEANLSVEKIKHLEDHKERVEEELARQLQSNRNLEADCAELRSRVRELQSAQHSSRRTQHDDRLGQTGEMERMQAELEQREKQLKQLRQEYDELEAEHRAALGQQTRPDRRPQLPEVEQSRLQQLQQSLELSQTQALRLQEQLNAAAEQNTRMEEEREVMGESQEAARREVSKLQQRLRQMQEREDEVRAALSRLAGRHGLPAAVRSDESACLDLLQVLGRIPVSSSSERDAHEAAAEKAAPVAVGGMVSPLRLAVVQKKLAKLAEALEVDWLVSHAVEGDALVDHIVDGVASCTAAVDQLHRELEETREDVERAHQLHEETIDKKKAQDATVEELEGRLEQLGADYEQLRLQSEHTRALLERLRERANNEMVKVEQYVYDLCHHFDQCDGDSSRLDLETLHSVGDLIRGGVRSVRVAMERFLSVNAEPAPADAARTVSFSPEPEDHGAPPHDGRRPSVGGQAPARSAMRGKTQPAAVPRRGSGAGPGGGARVAKGERKTRYK